MISTILGQQAKVAFQQAWMIIGKPTLEIVSQVSEWTLPEGYRYDKQIDAFRTVEGVLVRAIDWQTWGNYMTVPYIPGEQVTEMQLSLPGMTYAESLPSVLLLWNEFIFDILNRAWGVKLGMGLYRVVSKSAYPAGVDEPFYIQTALREDRTI